MDGSGQLVVLAGASGDLGRRISLALTARGAAVRALLRQGASADRIAAVQRTGATPFALDFADNEAMAAACRGAACVVSALNGLEPVVIGLQSRLLEAAVRAAVPRFIPSDFSLDFTRTRPGDNRNMDLRRRFMAQVDASPIRATTVLNGAFADLLTGQAPIVLQRWKRILYWGNADQKLDFTTKDDVADYAADAALDKAASRILRIAGDSPSSRDLAGIMTKVTGQHYKLLRAGGIGVLDAMIAVAKAVSPSTSSPFPAWQGMQYLRDMQSGRGKLETLDNDRYGKANWSRAEDVLCAAL